MKNKILILATLVLVTFRANAQIDLVPQHDSTIHQRFLVSLLNEYEKEGRWVFVRVDSLYKLKNNYEVINPLTFFNTLSDGVKNLQKSTFINQTFLILTEENVYERYANKKHLLVGKKVNMKRYNILKKNNIQKILKNYFDKEKKLKKKYTKWLNEIIAICFTKNVKVITSNDGSAHYEIFK